MSRCMSQARLVSAPSMATLNTQRSSTSPLATLATTSTSRCSVPSSSHSAAAKEREALRFRRGCLPRQSAQRGRRTAQLAQHCGEVVTQPRVRGHQHARAVRGALVERLRRIQAALVQDAEHQAARASGVRCIRAGGALRRQAAQPVRVPVHSMACVGASARMRRRAMRSVSRRAAVRTEELGHDGCRTAQRDGAACRLRCGRHAYRTDAGAH